MPAPFIYSRKIKFWNIVTMLTYAAISLGLMLYYYYNTTTPNPVIFYLYALGTQMFLYAFQYRAMRNFKMYLFWLSVGVMHLGLYFYLKTDPAMIMARGNVAKVFAHTILLVLFFQLLRYLSLKLQKQELVCTSKGNTDIFDDRKTGFLDFCFTITYMMLALLLSIFA